MTNVNRIQILLSVAVIATVLTAAIGIPMVTYGSGDDDEMEQVIEPYGAGDEYKVLSAFVAGLGLKEAIQGVFDSVKSWLGWGSGDGKPSGDDEAVKEALAELSLQDTVFALNTAMIATSLLIETNTDTLDLSQAHFNRVTEIASGTIWSSNTEYNPEVILEYADVMGNLSDIKYNVEEAVLYLFDNLGDRVEYWSEYDWGSTIEARFVWDGGSTPVAQNTLRLIPTSIVDATQTANRVYIDGGTTTFYSPTGGTIRNAAGIEVLSLARGEMKEAQVESGFYTLSQGTYAGPFLPAVTVMEYDCADVSAGVIMVCDTSYGLAESMGDSLRIEFGGSTITSSRLSYQFTSSDLTVTTGAAEGSDDDSITSVIHALGEQMRIIQDCIYDAAVAGQTMWMLSANANEANILLSPSSISPDLVELGFDANQSYALYVSALSQMSDYYDSYGDQLMMGDVRISEESLDLYCHGNIVDSDGVIIASDVIFTPIVYVRNMAVEHGLNTFTQDGLVMIWSSGPLADFVNSGGSDMRTVVMPAGSGIVVDGIVQDGEAVNSVALTVKEISRTDGLKDYFPGGVETPDILDATTLVMIIAIELAVIVALVGYAFRAPVLFLVAAVIALVALLATDWITDLLLEVFG